MKIVCGCGWVGDKSGLLRGKNPFDGSDIAACPKCKELNSDLRTACEEAGCNYLATCGTSTPDGYRNTCGEHKPKGARF